MAERLSQTVADDLLSRITRGEYRVGDRLPSEQQLVAQYHVGRNTVREAMQSLRTLGLVDIRPRLGARVLGQAAPNTLANSAVSMLIGDQTVSELYEVRRILEPAAAALAAKHRSDDDILAMRRARTHYRVAYEMGTPVWEADIEFHQAIAEASGNAVLAKVLAPVTDLLRNARQATGTHRRRRRDRPRPARRDLKPTRSRRARRHTRAPRNDTTHRIRHVGGQPTQGRRAGRRHTTGHRIGRLTPRFRSRRRPASRPTAVASVQMRALTRSGSRSMRASLRR